MFADIPKEPLAGNAWPVIRRRGVLWPERRVLICGPTDFENWDAVKAVLRSCRPTTLLHGHALGVDQLASLYAQLFQLNEMRFPAQWHTYGIAAADMRNEQMFAYGRPDLVLIFPGSVHGEDLQRRARTARIPVRNASVFCAATASQPEPIETAPCQRPWRARA